METIYNVEWDEKLIKVTRNDTINGLSFSVALNGVAYDMTGMRLDADIKDMGGTTIQTISTAGTSPLIVISTSTFSISPVAFANVGMFKMNVRLTNGAVVSTILRAKFEISEDIK